MRKIESLQQSGKSLLKFNLLSTTIVEPEVSLYNCNGQI